MNAHRQINLLTCRFSDPALERAYQTYMLSRHAFFDRFALGVGLVVYLSYAVMDLMVLDRAAEAIQLRVVGVTLCAIVLTLIQVGIIRGRLDRLIPLMVVFLGAILNLIIYIEPSIGGNYFIGLIQIAVFISFMLRAGFVSSNAALGVILAGYLMAVSNKDLFGTVQLTSQLYFLVMMFASCSAGIYILERYRRTLFLNARIIDEQNVQLERMIEELTNTVSRKTALLKVFTHIMKTPVHQIVGFLQVIRNEIDGASTAADTSESIRYAEAAAGELRRHVEEMIDYHFADNVAPSIDLERIDLRDMIEEYFYDVIENGKADFSGEAQLIETDQRLLSLALKHIRSFFRSRSDDVRSIIIERNEAGAIVVDFADGGAAIAEEDFRAMTCHLTAIENYLSGEGANPDMTLRTAARALERAGAALSPLPGGAAGVRLSISGRAAAAA